ncbi:hypothetical protein AMTRI_Chr05g70390 [Amborella trichopoda]
MGKSLAKWLKTFLLAKKPPDRMFRKGLWMQCNCAFWGSSQGCSVQDTPHECVHERTLKGIFFGNYKPHSDLPPIADKYMKKVYVIWRSSLHIQSYS